MAINTSQLSLGKRVAKNVFNTLMTTVMFALAACGGGGGGSGNSASSGGNSSTPTPITLTNGNGLTAIDESLNSYELLLYTGAFAATSFQQLGEATTPASIACDQPGGGIASTVLDKNNNGVIDGGDQITLVYTHCNSGYIGGNVDGTLVLNVQSFSHDTGNGLWSFSALATMDFSLERDGQTATTSGSFAVQYRLDLHGDSLTMQDGGGAIKIAAPNGGGNFTKFSVTKSVNSDTARYTFGGSLTEVNPELTQSISCSIRTNYSGSIDGIAESGMAQCSGAGNTSVTATMISPGQHSLSLVSNTGTTQLGGYAFDLYSFKFLTSTVLFRQPYGEGSNTTINANLPSGTQAFDFAVAELSGEDFIIVAGNSSPGSLMQIDPRTGNVSKTMLLPNNPCSIAVSADGQIAYIGYRDASRIDKIDLQSGQIIQQINVGSQTDSFTGLMAPLVAAHIEISPTNVNYLAVQTRLNVVNPIDYGDIYAFENGVRLSSSYHSPNNPFIFSSTGMSVIATQAGGGDLLTASSTGLTIAQPSVSVFQGSLDYYDGHLITATGKIWNTDALSQVIDLNNNCNTGSLSTGQCLLYENYKYVTHDRYLDRLYFTGYAGLTIFAGKSFWFLQQDENVSLDGAKALNRNQLVVGGTQFIGKNSLREQ